VNAVIPQPPDDHELQLTVARLIEVYSVSRVVEALGVCCELRACTMPEHDVATRRLREFGLQLIMLSERMFAL
jgi:hypothetical protein